ncbi:tRNA pseudouridine synthase B [Geodia barretti]|uniref:tRNA pseudouridine(55) synthase n=1 Tax=Geodia barretti TaxID=519541 RepID=A0AA35W9C8_GEOBA|nr:tRNA pseudouridine synthase B [Geodia barretti]
MVVDKPAGITSHDVVVWARRLLGVRRIGHTGTLDPLATGVLPLVVGRATRLAVLLSGGLKTYKAVIRLGVVTDTYDAAGTPLPAPPGAEARARSLDRDTAAAACRRFTGVFRQQPPGLLRQESGRRASLPVGAAPAGGRPESRGGDGPRLRDHCARRRLPALPGLLLARVLHADAGARSGPGPWAAAAVSSNCGASRAGRSPWTTPVNLEAGAGAPLALQERLIALDALLPELPAVVVTPHGAQRASHGNLLRPADIAAGAGHPAYTGADNVRVCDDAGSLLAIAVPATGGALHPRIVLV